MENQEFLQSKEWANFQKAYGRKTYSFELKKSHVNIIEHKLPLAGKYFYLLRGPLIDKDEIVAFKDEIIKLAKEQGIGWIRVEPKRLEMLVELQEIFERKVVQAPHNMQPQEVFMIDITKSEEQLLAEMKSKTRYNLRLAEKKGVEIIGGNGTLREENYIREFVRLTEVMAKRNGIQAHPERYYRKMLEIVPSDILKIYVAKYEEKVIAANLVGFYGGVATYMHGASDDEYRNVMAPYLLQWRQIQDAKLAGCTQYDFGGVKTKTDEKNNWQGITNFKLGFSPKSQSTIYPGCYDIVFDQKRYWIYRILQKRKHIITKLRKNK